MENLRIKVKDLIKEVGTVNSFADNHGIRRATLTDYLNGKKDITTRVFFKIIKPLKLKIS